jgi:RNA-binding protein
MDKELRRRLRAEGQRIGPTVQIGKGGLDEGVLAELDAQLRRNHLVKVRIQRGAAGGDRDVEEELGTSLAERLGAELVERRGHTVLVYRRSAKGPPTR